MLTYSRVRSSAKIFVLVLIAVLTVSFTVDVFAIPNLEPAARPLTEVPTFSKAFDPPTIGPGSSSTLTFNITNVNATPVTTITFTDNLPANVTIAGAPDISNTCDGTVTAPAGGTAITLTDGALGGFETCQISVNVTSSTAGTHNNVTGDLTSSEGNSGTATADLTVNTNRPGFSKSFSPSAAFLGDRSTLTFTIDNTLNGSLASFLLFTDNLPIGLEIADPPNVTNTCLAGSFTGGVVIAEPGTSVVSLSFGGGFDAGAVDAESTCTVSVDVVATGVGQLDNVSGVGTATVVATPYTMGKATAALTVTGSDLALIKSFSDDPAAPGSTTPLRFTLINFDRLNPANTISFTDDLDATLSGMTLAGDASNVCNGSGSVTGGGTGFLTFSGGSLEPEGSCTFTATVNIPAGTTAGVYPNTTSAVTSNLGIHNPASDTLFVQPVPLLTKSFTDDPVAAGGTVTLQFQVTNPSPTSMMTDIAFIDELTTFLPFPVSVTLPATPCGAGSSIALVSLGTERQGLSLTGGSLAAAGSPGDSCTFDVTIDIPVDLGSGSYLNTTEQPTATVDDQTYTGQTASDTLIVVGAPEFRKYFAGIVVPGGTVDLVFELITSENTPADTTNISFTDDLSGMGISGLTIASSLPQTNLCNGGTMSSAGSTLNFSGGTLAADSTCLITVTLQVPTTTVSSDYTNTTSDVTAQMSGLSVTGNAATADLTVAGLTFSKTFVGDPVLPGDTIPLVFTLVNSSTVYTASSIFFQDDLSNVLSGLAASVPPTPDPPCGAGSSLVWDGSVLTFNNGTLDPGASCIFTVTVQVPAGATSGTYDNTTSALSADIDGLTRTLNPATDALTVVKEVLLFSKTFVPNSAFPDDSVTLVFSITNSYASATATNIDFTDDLGAMLSGLAATGLPPSSVCGGGTLSGSDLLTFSGGTLTGGETCTFSATLTIPGGATAGDYTNTVDDVTASISGLAVTGNAASDDLTVVDPAASALLVIDKVTDPSGDTTSFDFAVKGPGTFVPQSFSLADEDPPQVIAAPTGVYTVTETVPTSWTLSSTSCSNNNPVTSVTISVGEVVTCTFYNALVGDIYLPIIFKDAIFLPDLVITSLTATTSDVTVVIQNQGNAAVTDAFWVDVYYTNSAPVLNQKGNVFWGLSVSNGGVPIAAGGVVALTLSSPYYGGGSPPSSANTTVYGQVDSIGPFSYGAVQESNENNNVFGPTTSTTALGGTSTSNRAPFDLSGLPPRP